MTSKYYTAKSEVVFMYVALKAYTILKRIIEFTIEKEIEEITILNPNLITDNINSRIQKLDLLIKTKNEYINIELNSNFGNLTKIRNLLYLFKIMLSQAEKGKNIYDLNIKTIQININFNSKIKEKEVLGLCDLESKQPVTDFFKIYNIYVDSYVEKYYNNNKQFENGEEIIIMLGLEKEELAELAQRSEIVMEYKKLVDEVNEDKSLFKWFSQEEEREMYEEALIRQSKEDGLIEGKQAGLIEGEKKGKEAGLIEGEKKGKEAGLIEGEKKGKKSGIISVAKNMIAEGMSIDLISKLTKLSKSQISRLL